MSYPLIPIFLKDVLKVGVGFIGLVEAVAEGTASLTKAFAGYLSDYLHRRKTLAFFGYALSTLGKPFLAVATSGWYVLAVRFVDRLGKGIRTAPRDALIADSADPRALGRAFGFHRAADTLGAVIGPLTAAALLSFFCCSYRTLFLLSALPGLISVAVIILLVRDVRPAPGRGPVASIDRTRDLPLSMRRAFGGLDRPFKSLLLVVIVFTLGNSSDAFLILRAKDLGVAVPLLPLLWMSVSVSYFLLSYPAGMLSDRIGRRKLLVAGFLLYAAVYAGLAFARAAVHAWLLFAVYGLYYGLVEANLKALIADLVPDRLRGTAYGLYATAVGVAILPANIMMGILWQYFGFQPAFMFGGALSLAAAGLLVLLVRQPRPAARHGSN